MSDYEITLPIRRPWLALAAILLVVPFKPFLLVLFLMGRGILRPQSSGEFMMSLIVGIPFLLFGLFFGLRWLRFILLNLIGEETLRLESGCISIRQSLFGFGKWKTFSAEKVTDLRTGWENLRIEINSSSTKSVPVEQRVKAAQWLSVVKDFLQRIGCLPSLMFRSKNQTFFFGSSVDRSQAGEILARLRMHLPEETFT